MSGAAPATLRVGVGFLNLAPSPERSDAEALFTELFEDAVWADGAGFDGLWVTEHHFSTYSLTSSPLLLLAQVAALAPRLRIGTSVLVLPLWDPVRLACDVSTLDVLSGGRLDVGIGRGYQPHEFRVFGREPDDSRARYEETALVLRKLLSERDAFFAGAFHRIDAPATVLPRVAQRPHPPVWAAALSPDSVAFAVREGFHFMVNAAMPEPAVLDHCRAVRRSLAAVEVPEAEREIAVNRFVYVGTDPATRRLAVREVARQLATSRALAEGGVPLGGAAPYPRVEELGAEELAAAENLLVAGSADEVTRRLARLTEVGVSYVIAGFRFGRFPARAARESMRVFAQECLPRLSP
ncbi:LLM class flavin-dependent oxidoreductase [Streptomyces sp. NPDC127039]|uniref:LLM class flavin-dependent oxidoreductase n=1 Tax=Streptomyces sp. NPDC127039 TaxID=3347115 RepID=UPI003649C438